MKAKEKVAFSKFFPHSQQFVVVEGKATSPSDFSINIDIGDGSEKTSFYIDSDYFKDNAAMLRAMRDAMQRGLEFYEKAMKLPVIKPAKGLDVDSLLASWNINKKPAVEAKAASRKKKVAKK